jgi:hypothetical protein
MTKHTPGPWKYQRDSFGCKEIASATGPLATTDGLADDDEDAANARLIAAAPEMLDALRQWKWAEANADESELQNARESRDQAIISALGELV